MNYFLQNKLMKLFARQLMHKHQYLQCMTDDIEEAERTLDSMISFEMFLSIGNLSPKTAKVFDMLALNM